MYILLACKTNKYVKEPTIHRANVHDTYRASPYLHKLILTVSAVSTDRQ